MGQIEVRGGFSRFVFTDEYLSSESRGILGLRFEQDLYAAYTGQDGLPSWFSNLLPEGTLRQLLFAELSAQLGRPPADIEMLLRVGTDLPGAVTIEPISDDVARRVRHPVDRVHEQPDALGSVLNYSVAGVGLKFSVLRQDEKFVAPASGGEGDWLLKLPDPMFRLLPVNEFASMSLAARVGIDVPDIRLVEREELSDVPDRFWRGETRAYAVRRFDRSGGARVHIEDFAQVRGFTVDQRYNGTFETLGALVWRGVHHSDFLEFVRRLTFNFLIGNDDAHLKNWSLIYSNPKVGRLSPAYDLASVEAYPIAGLERGTGLRINRSKRYEDLNLETFARLARKVGIDESETVTIVLDTVDAVSEHWDRYIFDLEDSECGRRLSAHRRRVEAALRAG